MKPRAAWFWTALRLALGALFLYASFYKIASPGSFGHEIHNYKLLPSHLVNPLAIVLPWVQLFVGISLLINRWVLGASALSALMLGVFSAAVASAVARDLNIACGCFKSGGSAATWKTFARDASFFIAAAVFFVRQWREDGRGAR